MHTLNKNTRFKTYARYVVDYKLSIGLKYSTYDSYLDLLVRIDNYIGEKKLKSLSSNDLNQIYADLGKEGANKLTGGRLSPKTILEHHRLINSILGHAVKEGILKFNVAQSALPPKAKKPRVNYLQIDQIKLIDECLKNEELMWKVLTHLFIISGGRRGEVAGLHWTKFDFSNCSVTFDSALYYTRRRGVYEDSLKTDSAERSIALPIELMNLILEYKDQQITTGLYSPNGFVFRTNKSEWIHPDTINDWLKKFKKRHNLHFKINPHAFRHSMASVLYKKNMDDVTISHRLGHAKVSTTSDIYAHILNGADEEAAECLADIFYRKK